VAAARLGFEPVTACDIELESLEATAAAAASNGVVVQTTRCDLRRGPGPHAPVVLANLVRPLLLELAQQLRPPPEHLIVSGLEDGEADEVAAAFAPLRATARLSGDGWTAIHLRS
jgi:ribosomal protein L11 methyltransferase